MHQLQGNQFYSSEAAGEAILSSLILILEVLLEAEERMFHLEKLVKTVQVFQDFASG